MRRCSKQIWDLKPSSCVSWSKVTSVLHAISMALEILRCAWRDMPRRPAEFQVQMESEAMKGEIWVLRMAWFGELGVGGMEG